MLYLKLIEIYMKQKLCFVCGINDAKLVELFMRVITAYKSNAYDRSVRLMIYRVR